MFFDMKSYTLPLIFATLNLLLLLTQSTPLCDLCPCNSKPNNPPHVNCVLNNLNEISSKSLWYNKQDEPYEIATLTISFQNLTTLNLAFPRSNLKLLDLSSNNISQIGEGVFGELQGMDVLVLADNKLKELNPESFKGIYLKNEYYPLRSLRTLNLESNYISELVEDTFEHIDELEVLILRNNPLVAINRLTVTAIASLANLQVLDLSETGIQRLPSNLMFVTQTLTKLDLSGNKFKTIPDTLQDAQKLKILILDNNPIKSLKDDNIFPPVKSLQELRMSTMPELSEIGAGSMSKLINLKELHLRFNKRLSHIHLHAMVRMERGQEVGLLLKTVLLNGNNLSYIDKEVLFNFDKIKTLDIGDNPLACNCRNEWLIDNFAAIEQKQKRLNSQLVCHTPDHMKGKSLHDLYKQNFTLRCLNRHTEENALLIIGVITGLMIIVTACLYVVVTHQHKRRASPYEYNVLNEIRAV